MTPPLNMEASRRVSKLVESSSMPGKLGFDNLQGRHPGGTSEVWLEVGSIPKCVMLFFEVEYKGWVFLDGFKYFLFHPYLGKVPILTNIFQMGWNHQAVLYCFFLGSLAFCLIRKIRPVIYIHSGPQERQQRHREFVMSVPLMKINLLWHFWTPTMFINHRIGEITTRWSDWSTHMWKKLVLGNHRPCRSM